MRTNEPWTETGAAGVSIVTATPLADIEFLVRSRGRAEVLATLRTSPRTVGELWSATEATRTTVGRALDDLESRRWVVWRDDRYELTALGAYLADGLADLVGGTEAGENLQDAIHWLVGERSRYDSGPFVDATLVMAENGDGSEPVSGFVQTLSGANQRRLLLAAAAARAIDSSWDGFTGTGETHIIADEEAIAALVGAHAGPSRLVEAVEAGRVTLHRCTDAVPHTIAITDEELALLVLDGGHTPRASVRTVDGEALAAAADRFKDVRDRTSPMSPDQFVESGDQS